MPVEATCLDTGTVVVTERMPGARSVALAFHVDVGSRDEPDELAGASHFLEHLLFKGTDRRSARQIAEAVDEVGGDLNAYTHREHVAFEVRLLAEHLDLGLDILSDIVWSPAFPPAELEAERRVIIEEILLSQDEPCDLVHDVLLETLFAGHPLGRSVLGTEASVSAIGRDDVVAFHAANVRAPHVVVAAAGLVDHAAVVDGVAARAAGSTEPRRAERTPPVPVASTTVVQRRTEQAHLVLGVPGVDARHPERYAAEVLVQALGGGISSRLFQEVRERRGLAYSVYAYRSAFLDAGAIAVYAGTSPRNAPAVVELLNDELDGVAARGLEPRELEIARGQVRNSTLLSLEDPGARMARLARAQVVHGAVPPLEEVLAAVDAVTLDDVGRVAADLLGRPRSLAVIGPFSSGAF